MNEHRDGVSCYRGYSYHLLSEICKWKVENQTAICLTNLLLLLDFTEGSELPSHSSPTHVISTSWNSSFVVVEIRDGPTPDRPEVLFLRWPRDTLSQGESSVN